ncbi:hypothetical protein ABZZ20_24165 [Streptomyces sp. NPDC006430]|uniref:hypothetical protein n=1 Tax=Streptomyces sp. NPDC006430 TaxID=3154299 RepID=UPI0033B450A9
MRIGRNVPDLQNDVSRMLAFATGSIVAVMTERWSSLVNVTVRVSSAACDMVVLNPRLGTAEIRHTPALPYRTVALPPCEEMVCRPGPPSSQSTADFGVLVPVAPDEALAGAETEAEGEGGSVTLGEPLADALGDGGLVDCRCVACQAGGVSKSIGADRATGGVCLVEPTTNWTVASTAVTLVAVHDSHMSR